MHKYLRVGTSFSTSPQTIVIGQWDPTGQPSQPPDLGIFPQFLQLPLNLVCLENACHVVIMQLSVGVFIKSILCR